MARGQTLLSQQDFRDGMQLDVAPHLISSNGVSGLENMLCDADGSLYKRGGTTYKSNAAFGALGVNWLTDIYLGPGQRTIFAHGTAFGVLGADDATPVNIGGAGLSYPKSAWEAKGYLFIGGGFIYGGSRKTATYSTGTVTTTNNSKTVTGAGTTWTTNLDAGMLFQTAAAERVYVIDTVDSNTQITLRDAYEGTTGAAKTYTARPIYTIAAAGPYKSAEHYGVCAGRLVWAFENKVRFVKINPIGATAPLVAGQPNNHAAWVSTDEHELPEGCRIVGFNTVGQILLIFTTDGLWTLRGLPFDIVDAAGTPNHRLQVLDRNKILWGSAGMASFEQSVVVPCVDGIFLIDGVSAPQRISKPIESEYRTYAQGNYRPGRAVVFRSHYFLPILDASGVWVKTYVCRLDRPVRVRGEVTFPWSRLTGAGGKIKAYAVRSGSDTRQQSLYGASANTPSRIIDCSSYFTPNAGNKLDADGSIFNYVVATRDYETGGGTINAVRKVRLRYELTDAGSDNPTIQADVNVGTRQSGLATWGQAVWGAFTWNNAEDAAWLALVGDAPEDTGRSLPKKWRVGKKARYVRYRFRSDDPAASCVIRAVETFIRPAGSLRR